MSRRYQDTASISTGKVAVTSARRREVAKYLMSLDHGHFFTPVAIDMLN